MKTWKMATGATKTNYFYQNGKLSTNSANMEVSQDMHLKMSKKIAQLTKVIYALNTKNDEHDAVVASIRGQNEEEKAQLLSENRWRLESYKQQLLTESGSQQQLKDLQQKMQEQETYKQKAILEFEKYKTESEEKVIQLKTEHAQRIVSLSQDVLKTKKEFEDKLLQLEVIKQQYERDKFQALEEERAKHEAEIECLRNELKMKVGDISEGHKELNDKYELDLKTLRAELEKLESDKKQLVEDYEHKLKKAQAFYDKELEALQQSQNSSQEEQLTTLREHQKTMQKDFEFQEAQFKKRIEGLVSQLCQSDEQTEKYKNEVNSLKNMLSSKETETSLLNSQVADARQQASEALTRLKVIEGELAASRERCEQQAADLLHKSTGLGELEAKRLQHLSTISDLKAQIEKLRDRLNWLEEERRTNESQNQDHAHLHSQQVRSLEKSLNALSTEKQEMKEDYEKQLRELEDKWLRRQQAIMDENQKMIDHLKQLHQEEGLSAQKEAEALRATLKQDLERQMEAERNHLVKEKQGLEEKYTNRLEELTSRLSQSNAEVERLQRLVTESEHGLGSATSNLTSLQELADQLKAELEQSRQEHRTIKSQAASLQAEYDKLKLLHDSKLKAAEQELKEKLDQLAVDLNNKWTITLRQECSKLRRELTEQKEEDKRAAIAQLTQMKDEEMAAGLEGWQRKVNELLSQISKLNSELDSQQALTSDQLDKYRKDAEKQNKKLQEELLSSAEDYAEKVESLECLYKRQLDELERKKSQEAEDQGRELRKMHMEELQCRTLAHHSAIDQMKRESENTRKTDLDTQAEKHRELLEALRTELEHKLAMELEQTTRAHQLQIQAARMELERAIEVTKQKEGEHAMQMCELQEEMRLQRDSSHNLEQEIIHLQQGVTDLSHELEVKGKEILRIRSEANHAARIREEQLISDYKHELSALQSDHDAGIKEMLAEFTHAQELLKEKISDLQSMLEAAEERYLKRESREEDLDRIEMLQEAILEKEAIVKKMEDDKRYYQLELVNRETNFNKVFTSSPNVGVLNPLAPQKKVKNEKPPLKFRSSPALSNRLEPLPGSPIHDGHFNMNKPLPPPMKKFVK